MTEQIESEQTDTTVVVSRVVSHPLKSVWSVLMTKEGNEAILGPGGQFGGKGDNWEAADGTYGVTRSFHPLEQIRFSWHQDADSPRTMVDLRVSAHGDDQTLIEVTQSPVTEGLDPDRLRARWDGVLARIENEAL